MPPKAEEYYESLVHMIGGLVFGEELKDYPTIPKKQLIETYLNAHGFAVVDIEEHWELRKQQSSADRPSVVEKRGT